MKPLQSVPPHIVPSTIRPPTKRPGTIRPLYKASPATKRPRNKASPFEKNIVVKINLKFFYTISYKKTDVKILKKDG